MIFDILQAFFWSITYILIILYSYREKVIAIPPIAIASNYAWETVALLRDILQHSNFSDAGAIIHLVWFSFDTVIVLIYLLRCKPVSFSKWVFAGIFFSEVICLSAVFRFVGNGILLSCFVIDLIMAVEWLFYGRNKTLIPNALAICIALAKLFGDGCAWLCYRNQHILVNIIGICVLLLNIGYFYILLCRNKHEKNMDALSVC